MKQEIQELKADVTVKQLEDLIREVSRHGESWEECSSIRRKLNIRYKECFPNKYWVAVENAILAPAILIGSVENKVIFFKQFISHINLDNLTSETVYVGPRLRIIIKSEYGRQLDILRKSNNLYKEKIFNLNDKDEMYAAVNYFSNLSPYYE